MRLPASPTSFLTPIRDISEFNIGSRPASRKPADQIKDLRAIPWVLSRGFNRALLPGWYGFGSAARQFIEREGQAGQKYLQAMNKHWVFFRGLLSMTDMGISSRYAELVLDKALRERIFGAIEAEWRITIEMLFKITGASHLLQDNPTLARSLITRAPYIDPLNHLQASLLHRHRSGDDDERFKCANHVTINGIEAGSRNSG